MLALYRDTVAVGQSEVDDHAHTKPNYRVGDGVQIRVKPTFHARDGCEELCVCYR